MEKKQVKFIDLNDPEQSVQFEKRLGYFAESVISYVKRFPMDQPRSAAEFILVRTLAAIADQFLTIKGLVHIKNVSKSDKSSEAGSAE